MQILRRKYSRCLALIKFFFIFYIYHMSLTAREEQRKIFFASRCVPGGSLLLTT